MTGWFAVLTAVWMTGFVMGSVFERLARASNDEAP
jgi:hypothetical protein